jgi:hypothetical protein
MLINSFCERSSCVCNTNVSRLPVRLVDSFTAPKDILQEFADFTEEENVDLFILQKVF